jgi:hypothetical protein
MLTDPNDVETVLAYYVDGQAIDAAEIQHRKANVDANVRRGLPLYFSVRKNLRRAEKLLRNMSVVAEIQSAIALIRKHHRSNRGAVEQFVAASADVNVTNSVTGQSAATARARSSTPRPTSITTSPPPASMRRISWPSCKPNCARSRRGW